MDVTLQRSSLCQVYVYLGSTLVYPGPMSGLPRVYVGSMLGLHLFQVDSALPRVKHTLVDVDFVSTRSRKGA